jgi:type II secretory pathway component PulK
MKNIITRTIKHINVVFSNKGYVLIIVLIIIAAIISISSEFLTLAQTNTKYLQSFTNRQKAYWVARSGINLAIELLEADKKGSVANFISGDIETDPNIDSYKDIWALPLPEIPLENGNIQIHIEDENSKINLSVLANEFVEQTPYYIITQRFCINMGLPLDLADCILDWVDIDDARSPYGAESSDYYQNLKKPYKVKNDTLDSINELLLIKNITPLIFYGLGGGNFGLEQNLVDDNKGLQNVIESLTKSAKVEIAKSISQIKIGKEKNRAFYNYFRVNGDRSDYLNDINKININTASYRVLSALTDSMTDDKVTELIRRRLQKPFKNVDEISDIITDENVRKNLLTVRSYIFQIRSIGKVGSTTLSIIIFYHRERKQIIFWSEA